MGVVLGGRLGYVFFYQFDRLLAEPTYLLRIWEGGMSFHGGLLGVIVALAWLARRSRLPFLAVADFTAPLVPLGLGFGRLGNFINGELPGRVTEVPWGVVYPGEVLARHPSSLYQATAEGLLLFTALWLVTARPRPLGFASGAFSGLWVASVCHGIFPRPGSPPGLPVPGADHGSMALPTHALGGLGSSFGRVVVPNLP